MASKYIMGTDSRAMFNKDGNIKLGNSWSFSMAMGDSLVTADHNGRHYECLGTCGHYCSGCKNDCYVKKSYRYTSVRFSHIRNTLAILTDMAAAFSDLQTAIDNARRKPEIIRINQSGEIINSAYLSYWSDMARHNPDIVFWMYTKAYDVVIPALKAGQVPDNLTVLISIWHEFGIEEFISVDYLDNVKAFVYDDGYDYESHDIIIQTYCMAYVRNTSGKMVLNHDVTCDKCRKCFNRSRKCTVIGCLAH